LDARSGGTYSGDSRKGEVLGVDKSLLMGGTYLADRVRRFLYRRHKLRIRGTARFGYAEVYGEAGVIDIHQTRRVRRPAHALS
jgi:hypothetical protein